MQLISPASRITVSLIALTYGAILLAAKLGFFPNEEAIHLRRRTSLAEVTASNVAVLAQAGKQDLVARQLAILVHRNDEVLSAAVRRWNGQVYAATEQHEQSWDPTQKVSSRRRIILPVLDRSQQPWGQVEIAFRPLPKAATGGSAVTFAIFASGILAVFYIWYLDRSLSYLNPARTVPNRVRSALNTLAEGLLVLDDDNRIVLANDSFGAKVGVNADQLVGKKVDELPWKVHGDSETPWDQSGKCSVMQLGKRIGLSTNSKDAMFLVNSSPILGEDGNCRGVLASFDDITDLEAKKIELQGMLEDLRESRRQIQEQNQELQILATRDPLTGCVNRRTFFERFESLWSNAVENESGLHCLMIDIDFFKSINDDYGHSAGDEVLRSVAKVLLDSVDGNEVACRYGGEEFCVLLPDMNVSDAEERGEQIRQRVEQMEFPDYKLKITASLGLSCIFSGAAEPQELLDQADKCLYVAKRNGRNQLVYFEDVPDDIVVDESQISRTKPDDQATGLEGNSRIPYAAVASLLSALSYRDAGTAAHSKRVSELSIAMARGLMSAREIYVLEVAALLHDIGKIGVPDSILLKPGPLTKEEWQIMSKHDDIGVDILAAAFSCPELSEIVRCHHAFYGANNQDLPTGEAIPLASRIITLADAYDAMVSDRVYRKGMPPADAFAELRRCSGTQFDPQLVERLIEVAQCREREYEVAKGSKQAALEIGENVERLVEAVDNEDIESLRNVTERLRSMAAKHDVPEMTSLCNELLKQSETTQAFEIIEGIMDICRSFQRVYIEHADSADAP